MLVFYHSLHTLDRNFDLWYYEAQIHMCSTSKCAKLTGLRVIKLWRNLSLEIYSPTLNCIILFIITTIL
jgi:hypothetical protein